MFFFFFSSRRRHTRLTCDWSSDVCSSDLRCGILFEQQTIEGFGFDPELLFLARRHGLRAVEIPVRWGHSPATKVSMLHDSIQMFIDVFTIRWNSLRGRYLWKA